MTDLFDTTEQAPAPEVEAEPTPNVLHDTIIVPAGHVWSSGRTLERTITLVLTYGVRWRPHATEPRWHASAIQFFHGGDGIGYNADTLLAEFLSVLSDDAIFACKFDGKKVMDADADWLQRLGIAVPNGPETYEAINSDRAYAKAHGIIR